ncbi:LysR substrate-binding domain-containing protein [Agrococcus sp. Ld7]|uniref:LysR family transcriptional regulator n=1 Tax=Agrococcus sp. Ld7 TaxID=649148 RepID=UPI0038697436
MAMKLEHLRAFDAIARAGTFTRAAEQLFIAQPSLSRQVAALEAELGTPLFRRGAAGAALTAAGELLLPIARRMFAEERVAHEQLDELAGLRRGSVRLGAPPTLCVSLVADVLAAFRGAHPGVDLHITEGGSGLLMEALQEGALDLALVVTRDARPVPAAIEVVPLLSEELVVVSGEGHHLQHEVSLAELARVPQVAFNRGYDLRVATDAAFAAAGLTPAIAVEGAEMDAVLRFVERGIGVAVVPAMVVVDRPGLRSARLVRPSLCRTVNLARRADVQPSAASTAMQHFVFTTVERLAAADTELSRRVTAASALAPGS